MRALGLIVTGMTLLAAVPTAAAPVVKTQAGPIAGLTQGSIDRFRGIPFAAPPVGALRWRAPQPVTPWTEVKDATQFGKSCLQNRQTGEKAFIVRPEDMSEDCLTINVDRPKGAKKRPVLVWIHGGGLRAGSSALPLYDGSGFAGKDVVFVSFNYRLGLFGYFTHPGLVRENRDGGRFANHGLLDQIAALKWVKANIEAFGGDPDNVTIFGESAGALSVYGLMISPEARGLFSKAVSQSGYGRGPFRRVTETAPDGQPSAAAQGVRIAQNWGLSADATADELRAVPAGTIVNTTTTEMTNLTLDGVTITNDMWVAFRDGKAAQVPLVLGTTSLEFSGAKEAVLDPYIARQDRNALKAWYGTGQIALDNLWSDFVFTQQTRAIARMHAQNGNPTYLYLFDVVPELSQEKGAAHASELRYLFGTLGVGSVPLSGDAVSRVSATMQDQWVAFAKTGRPEGKGPESKGLPDWPRYTGCNLMTYTLTRIFTQCDPRTERLDALSEIVDPKSY